MEGLSGSVGTAAGCDRSDDFLVSLPWWSTQGLRKPGTMSPRGTNTNLGAQHLHGDMITAEGGGVVRFGQGAEGGDSNSCREEDRKWRAVVFVTSNRHSQWHDGNVLAIAFDKE